MSKKELLTDMEKNKLKELKSLIGDYKIDDRIERIDELKLAVETNDAEFIVKMFKETKNCTDKKTIMERLKMFHDIEVRGNFDGLENNGIFVKVQCPPVDLNEIERG